MSKNRVPVCPFPTHIACVIVNILHRNGALLQPVSQYGHVMVTHRSIAFILGVSRGLDERPYHSISRSSFTVLKVLFCLGSLPHPATSEPLCIFYRLHGCDLSRMPWSWNHRLCRSFTEASWTWNRFSFPPCLSWRDSSFLFSPESYSLLWMCYSLFILKDILIAPRFYQLWIKLL